MTIARRPMMSCGARLVHISERRVSTQESHCLGEQYLWDFFSKVMAGGQRPATNICGDLLPFLERFEATTDRALGAP